MPNSPFTYLTKLPKPHTGNAYWFIFSGQDLLIYNDETKHKPLPFCPNIDDLNLNIKRQVFIGTYQDYPCYSVELDTDCILPEELHFEHIKQSFLRLHEELFWLANTALQVLNWDIDHQFCSRCATPLTLKSTERAKQCKNCDYTCYPKITPAIIVRITRGDEILLARSPHFIKGIYALIAGFIEPGESAEQAIHREVHEEIKLSVKNIKYFDSQSWPPASLMLGFTCEYDSGEIEIDGEEICAADWFSLENLPKLPISASISRRLIDDFISISSNLA